MRAASREALGAAKDRLDAVVDSLSADDLRVLGEELFAVLGVLVREHMLRRHLADPSTDNVDRKRLADVLIGGKVGASARDTIVGLVGSRWSASADLLDGLELLAIQATLALAEREGVLEDVEDELFRFGRILAGQPSLYELLSDRAVPAAQRIGLLEELLADKVTWVTRELLRQAIRVPRASNLEMVVGRLAEQAAARRNRSVAHVTAAAALTEEQESRLAEVLSAIFNRPVSIQLEVDPELLGGLVIRVGDEVIDGSVAARLAAARQHLPH